MKALKMILKILLVVIFIFSIAINVLLWNSSYGSLIFKHNEEKLLAMASSKRLEFEPNYFLQKQESGFQIYSEVREGNKIEKYTYKYHFDKDSKITAFVSSSTQTEDSFKKIESYYKEEVLYKEENGVKFHFPTTVNTVVGEILTSLNALQDSLITNIETTDTKAVIDFSFSPFYVIGLRYTVKEAEQTTTYSYDLKGNLRKLNIKYSTGKTINYEINYKNKKIDLPDLSQY